ncbi:SCP2 sterol-binding domain-containing protein [Tistrella bauzanensis]|uniref:SCP2 sterol-binding domain-containing protein n=2 Tax=Tistrella TaxID=171436 RepID=A0ABU9YHD4_9PROT|nr:SCP2 sterol-binding domain-containing protein [Tistrella bauzanensis]GGB26833.1 sterol-binding protein [Tistrella bauzanensis]
MSTDDLVRRMQDKATKGGDLGATVKFVLEDGVIFVDGRSSPAEVSDADRDADCTIRCSAETLDRLMTGDLSATMAFMTGKIKVEGDMTVAMKLSAIL